MAMNPMQKKARTSFLLGMFLTLVITGLIIVFLEYQLMNTKKEEEAVVFKEVYTVSQDIKSGGKLLGCVIPQNIDSTLVPNNAITAETLGQYVNDLATAKIALSQGTIITPDMINVDGKQETSDVRLQEYNMLLLPQYLATGDYVDIRLRLPTGEDYIVLSKKQVENNSVDTIWLKLTEDEILTMSNAIVETYIMNGSLLYVTTYSDAGMQEQSTPTYVVKNSVINLMNADPNITKTAKEAVAARYSEAARAQREAISQALDAYNDQALTNVEQKLETEIEKQQTARQDYLDELATN